MTVSERLSVSTRLAFHSKCNLFKSFSKEWEDFIIKCSNNNRSKNSPCISKKSNFSLHFSLHHWPMWMGWWRDGMECESRGNIFYSDNLSLLVSTFRRTSYMCVFFIQPIQACHLNELWFQCRCRFTHNSVLHRFIVAIRTKPFVFGSRFFFHIWVNAYYDTMMFVVANTIQFRLPSFLI